MQLILKVFFFTIKQFCGSISISENVEREPIKSVDEQVPPSDSIHRKMSRDTTPIGKYESTRTVTWMTLIRVYTN